MDLLSPQIEMEVDDHPLELIKDMFDDSNSEDERTLDDDSKVKLLLENEFYDPAQVPDQLSDFEKEAKRNVFALGEPAIQYQRLHCTACNIHLGSAPINHFNRYIHPLLKVLVCKQCYDFYCSGDFDKDEDGSEMYCRWCGQGGKVMCCAQCAYVFCQKCVRHNLGKKTLDIIKDSDDWKCFSCNPTQLINLKIICTTLFDFVQEQIRLSKSLNNVERLKVDYTFCCQKKSNQKRKRTEEDTVYNPLSELDDHVKPKKGFKQPISVATTATPTLNSAGTSINNASWNRAEEDEVVCTPDLPSLMDEIPVNQTPPLNAVGASKPPQQKKNTPILPKLTPFLICAPNNQPVLASSKTVNQTVKFTAISQPNIRFVSQGPNPPSVPYTQILPGLKHNWFDKASTIVSTITGNLSTTLAFLCREQKNAKTVEQLATVHNKLQELLSTSVNSLIQVRKSLRSEFLGDLNKLKFIDSKGNVSSPRCRLNNGSESKENAEKVNDDDVIFVNDNLDGQQNLKVTQSKRSYLKVRTVADLQSVPSECITIPDDPVGSKDDVIAVEESDPLSVSPPREVAATSEIDKVPEDNENAKASKSSVNLKEVSGRDYIMINNALTESKIDQLVEQNFKYSYGKFTMEEVRKMLAVRVILGVDYKSFVPKHRVKTVDWPMEDEDVQLAKDTTENENCDQVENVPGDSSDKCNDTEREERERNRNVSGEEQSVNLEEGTNVAGDEATVNDDEEMVSQEGTDDDNDAVSKETDEENEDTEVDDENGDSESESSDNKQSSEKEEESDTSEGNERIKHSGSEHKNDKHNNINKSCTQNDEHSVSKDDDDNESSTKIKIIKRDKAIVKSNDKDSQVCNTSKLDHGTNDNVNEPSKEDKCENENSGNNTMDGQLQRLMCDKPNTSVSAFSDNSSTSDEDHDDFVDNLLKRDVFSNEPITTDFGIEVDGK